MKLHIGCGTIYLKDYVNIDGKADFMANNCPADVMEKVATTLDRYYKHPFGHGAKKVVVDAQFDIGGAFPYQSGTAEEAVMMHVLEHFPLYRVGGVLEEIRRVLKPGGAFVVAVPDVKGMAKMLAEAETPEEEDLAIRFIHGTQRNEYAHHLCGYTPRTLKSLLSEHGFGKFQELPNINCYPAVHLKAHKIGD